MLWILISVGGSVVLTTSILVVVFATIRRRIDQEAQQLDDVVLDTGATKMTTRYDGFRSEQLVRGGLRRNHVRAVLTETHLHLIERPQHYGVFARADLPRFTVGVVGNDLHLRSTDPPEATGTIDYRIRVDDPMRWVEALRAAGARSEQLG